jgi:DNA excision repair protein ERCC-4
LKVEDLTALIDSREQRPLKFRTMKFERASLPTADYSVRGPGFDLRDTVLIERKSVADLVGSLGTGRARFERELERLAKVRWKALVIEGGMREIAEGSQYSGMTPKQIMSPLHAWCWKYGIAVWPCPDRAWAARTVELLLWHAARYVVEATTKAGKK